MAYPVQSLAGGGVKMSDGTVQASPDTFSASSPASVVGSVVPSQQIQLPSAQVASTLNIGKAPAIGNQMNVVMPQQQYIQQAAQNMPSQEGPPAGQVPTGGQIPDIILDARNAIMSGMRVQDMDKYYPELKGTDKTIFAQLEHDVNTNANIQDITKAYPELFSAPPTPTTSAATFQDQHAGEGSIEQTAKAGFRAIGDTAKSIVGAGEQALGGLINVAEKGAYSAVKNIADIAGYRTEGTPTGYEQTGLGKAIGAPLPPKIQDSLMANASAIPAGITSEMFNLGKLPIALGINTASELPGAQYIIQGISKGLEITADGLALATGMDKQTAQNSITTVMNIMGLKLKGGGTMESAGKAAQAFENAPTVAGGIARAGASIGGDVLSSTEDVAKIPYDIAKGAVNLVGKPIEKLSGAIGKTYDTAITGLPEAERKGLQANPYQAEEFKSMAEKQQSTTGIDDIKNYTTDRITDVTKELTDTIKEMQKTKGEDATVYNDIRNLKTPVPAIDMLGKIDSTIRSSGLDIQDGNVIRIPGTKAGEINQADVSKLNQLYQDIKADATRNNGDLTVSQTLDARKNASNLAKYDATTTTSGQNLMRSVRGDIDFIAKNNIPGLRELDRNFVDKLNEYQDATRDLVYKQGTDKGDFRSNVESIISNLDKPNRAPLLARLEEIQPGIGARIEAIRNLPKLHKAMMEKVGKLGAVSGAVAGATTLGSIIPVVGHVLGAALGAAGGTLAESAITKIRTRAIENVVSKTSEEGMARMKEINDKIANNEKIIPAEKKIIQGIKNKISNETKRINREQTAKKIVSRNEMIRNKLSPSKQLALPPASGKPVSAKEVSIKTMEQPSKGKTLQETKDEQAKRQPEITARSKIVVPNNAALTKKVGKFESLLKTQPEETKIEIGKDEHDVVQFLNRMSAREERGTMEKPVKIGDTVTIQRLKKILEDYKQRKGIDQAPKSQKPKTLKERRTSKK